MLSLTDRPRTGWHRTVCCFSGLGIIVDSTCVSTVGLDLFWGPMPRRTLQAMPARTLRIDSMALRRATAPGGAERAPRGDVSPGGAAARLVASQLEVGELHPICWRWVVRCSKRSLEVSFAVFWMFKRRIACKRHQKSLPSFRSPCILRAWLRMLLLFFGSGR